MGALGAAWGIFRATAKSNTLAVYEKEIDIRGEINNRLEKENERLRTRLDVCNQDIAVKAQEIARWQESVTQRAKVEELTRIMEKTEKDRQSFEGAINILLRDILAQLKNQRGVIG